MQNFAILHKCMCIRNVQQLVTKCDVTHTPQCSHYTHMLLASHSHAHASSHHLITNLCILYIVYCKTVMSGARVCIYYISGLKYQFVTGRRSYSICTYVVITGQAKQAFIANLYMSLCIYIHVLTQ